MSENTCPAASAAESNKPKIIEQSEYNNIKKVIAIVSGKGGVGKSSVSALMAIGLRRQGYKVGILDADITGPSIPKMFGLNTHPESLDDHILPVKTSSGILVISLNLFLVEEDEPVIWRGPVLANVVKQFWTDVVWGDLDYLIVDLPPGTGDIPLTAMQSLPLDGLVVVTSPQDLAMMVVKKAVKMAEHMNIPILGMVENMSYLKCPDCGKEIYLFGPSKVFETTLETGMRLIDKLPVDPELAALADQGKIERYQTDAFKGISFN
ncbi:MAG: ATPase-like, ParA/MinD [Desulfotomaculum sp. 46_296]|nr:MAG: ATPase-like, ParA/MinD [Desulfotomaculum sp. 46_296]HAU31380.1 ATP-binding protein [Desulfotomaculum sp.]